MHKIAKKYHEIILNTYNLRQYPRSIVSLKDKNKIFTFNVEYSNVFTSAIFNLLHCGKTSAHAH